MDENMPGQATVSAVRPRGYRSLFWPVLLIGVGVVWLMANFGLIGGQSFWALLRLWPLILIAIGVDILFGRSSPVLGGLIGLALVGLLVALLLLAAPLGLDRGGGCCGWFSGRPVELRTERFVEPLDGATSAEVSLDLAWEQANIRPVSDPANLFEADVTYAGDIGFEVGGGARRRVSLSEEPRNFSMDRLRGYEDARWEIGLNPDVPMELTINIGVSQFVLDLRDLNLTGLEIDGGVGTGTIYLPATGSTYRVSVDVGVGTISLDIPVGAAVEAQVDGGVGSFNAVISDNADVSLEIDGSMGSVSVDVPDGAAVRVVVYEGGIGGLHLPGNLTQVDDGYDVDPQTGTWETPGFSNATHQIVIVISDLSAGSVAVR